MKLLPWLASALLLLMSEIAVHGGDDGAADQLEKQLIELRKQSASIRVGGAQQARTRPLTPAEVQAYEEQRRIHKEIMDVTLKLAQADPGSDRGLTAIQQRMN